MIPVPNPIQEPKDFNKTCRKRGRKWLHEHPDAKPDQFPGYWRDFQPDLARAFQLRCGWTAMHIGTDGAVDHFQSRSGPNGRNLAYEWCNYRYISTTVNSSKQALDAEVLDPFEVESGWFEVLLPSFILVRTEKVPVDLRAKADFTISRLKLDTGEKFIANRREWYRDHVNEGLPISNLRKYAPLIAEAIEAWQNSGRQLPEC